MGIPWMKHGAVKVLEGSEEWQGRVALRGSWVYFQEIDAEGDLDEDVVNIVVGNVLVSVETEEAEKLWASGERGGGNPEESWEDDIQILFADHEKTLSLTLDDIAAKLGITEKEKFAPLKRLLRVMVEKGYLFAFPAWPGKSRTYRYCVDKDAEKAWRQGQGKKG